MDLMWGILGGQLPTELQGGWQLEADACPLLVSHVWLTLRHMHVQWVGPVSTENRWLMELRSLLYATRKLWLEIESATNNLETQELFRADLERMLQWNLMMLRTEQTGWRLWGCVEKKTTRSKFVFLRLYPWTIHIRSAWQVYPLKLGTVTHHSWGRHGSSRMSTSGPA